jgi:hypothetical protein
MSKQERLKLIAEREILEREKITIEWEERERKL